MELFDVFGYTILIVKWLPLILISCGNLMLKHNSFGSIRIGDIDARDDVRVAFQFPASKPFIDFKY
ncbi:hypothetical protein [Vibrio sp. D431a]|uniref:hypothetical protein n=1 Tax=Vibrio sp. D431a TaxID=2837388 RepID=UPI002553431E|nr:hypothetical protein [Vibrio sp. D431a]MDK9790056.1 hypothetical protein [Vibrio sp. D431a]